MVAQTKFIVRSLVLFALALLALTAVEAWAQPLATLRWQLTPFCNVVTLNVTEQGSIFTLDGHDDQCGAGQRARVRFARVQRIQALLH